MSSLRASTAKKRSGGLTYNEVDVLRIAMPLEFEGEFVQIPDSHLGFVRPRCDCMMSVPGGFDFVARLWKLESLDEF